MIIILKSNVTEEQIQHVLERVQSLGLQAHLSRGTYRTIIGIIGDEEKLQFEPLLALPGVQRGDSRVAAVQAGQSRGAPATEHRRRRRGAKLAGRTWP